MALLKGPLNWPRPYHDITQADPLSTPFNKSKWWALYRGFYDQHHENYGTSFTEVEPLEISQ